jgi:hypothetical protein
MEHLVSRALQVRSRGCTAWNVKIVICVIKQTDNWKMWSHINMYILESIHIAVMCAIKRSVTNIAYRHINVYILGSVHIAVMYVIKRSVAQVT